MVSISLKALWQKGFSIATIGSIPMTMADWASKLDAFLQFNDAEILHDKGKVTVQSPRRLKKANLNSIVFCKIRATKAILIGWSPKA